MTCPKCWIPAITDYIGFYENIIPDTVCDKIMAHDWGMRKSTYSNNDGKSKTSDERVEMDEVWVTKDMPFYDDIKNGVLKTIKKYSKHHRNFSCIHHTDFRINKYSEGGFMSKHVDNIHKESKSKLCSHFERIIFYESRPVKRRSKNRPYHRE